MIYLRLYAFTAYSMIVFAWKKKLATLYTVDLDKFKTFNSLPSDRMRIKTYIVFHDNT